MRPPNRLVPILLMVFVSACSGASVVSHIVSVKGSIGPLQLAQSTRGEVIAYAGKPNLERRGRGEGLGTTSSATAAHIIRAERATTRSAVLPPLG